MASDSRRMNSHTHTHTSYGFQGYSFIAYVHGENYQGSVPFQTSASSHLKRPMHKCIHRPLWSLPPSNRCGSWVSGLFYFFASTFSLLPDFLQLFVCGEWSGTSYFFITLLRSSQPLGGGARPSSASPSKTTFKTQRQATQHDSHTHTHTSTHTLVRLKWDEGNKGISGGRVVSGASLNYSWLLVICVTSGEKVKEQNSTESLSVLEMLALSREC